MLRGPTACPLYSHGTMLLKPAKGIANWPVTWQSVPWAPPSGERTPPGQFPSCQNDPLKIDIMKLSRGTCSVAFIGGMAEPSPTRHAYAAKALQGIERRERAHAPVSKQTKHHHYAYLHTNDTFPSPYRQESDSGMAVASANVPGMRPAALFVVRASVMHARLPHADPRR